MSTEHEKALNRAKQKRYADLNREKVKERYRLWYVANKNKSRQATQRWIAKNKDSHVAVIKAWEARSRTRRNELRKQRRARSLNDFQKYARQFYQKHKDKLKAAVTAYKKRNRAKYNRLNAARRSKEMCATPTWANTFFMDEIYDLSRLRAAHLGIPHQVDHIVPLLSRKVCGLHCEFNLRVITAKENNRKYNSYWPDMPCVTS